MRSATAQSMRRILVVHARKHRAAIRGGSDRKLSLDDPSSLTAPAYGKKEEDVDPIALDEALDELAKLDSQQSRVVELRFLGGLTVEETAEVLGISPATVKRAWSCAKAWLYRAVTRGEDRARNRR